MLAILRQKLAAKKLSAPVDEQDMCNLALTEKFDLIIIPFNSFAEIISPDEQRQALTGIGNCLTDAGRFICTLHNPQIRHKFKTELAAIKPSKRVYVDESGMDSRSDYEYGWSNRGQKFDSLKYRVGKVPHITLRLMFCMMRLDCTSVVD